MTLLLDVGNSRLKWAWLDGDGLRPGTPFPSRAVDLAGAFEAAWDALPRPVKICGCNVAGEEIRAAVETWAARRWGCPCRWIVSTAEAYGVTNGYEDPARLGADRWLALIAARRFFPLPLCVADCGTAVTVDALDADGRHLGGVIAPGLEAMRSALPLAVPMDAATAGAAPLGRNTVAAIGSGVLHAAAGLIGRVHAHCRTQWGQNPELILTGGDAARIAAVLDIPHWVEADLLLRGLAWLSNME
ncbi:MAG TPA: type III pantothenate kinase [Methylococcaceae bacterium]|nr:type III pantothenate kinase [Methylococcaceae bacterium]